MTPDKKSGQTEPAGRRPEAGKPAVPVRRRRKSWLLLTDVLIVLLVVSGLYLIISPIVIHSLQDKLTRDLATAYDQGDGTIVIEPDYLEVEGEEINYPDVSETANPTPVPTASGSTAIAATPTPVPQPVPVKVTVKAIGRIIIPAIDVDMPVAEGSTRYNLRVAISHYSPSAGFGATGNCILFGHRMYTYGRHFNRLGEVQIGQQVILEDKVYRYIYEVDQIDTILPGSLVDELYAKVEGSRIMLVTCTPVRIASHRLLVKGKLISTESLH